MSRSRFMPASVGFRRLAYIAVALTLALVVVGGVVRVSDSGLGCGPAGSGTEGWPLCGGRVIPLVDTNMIVEYAHRVLAGALTVVIAALALQARRRRYRPDLRRLTTAAFALVLFQAALGGLTVEKGLDDELVAAHLGVAMLQLALLIGIAYLARPESDAPGAHEPTHFPPSLARGGVRVLAIGAAVAVLGAIVAGGYMSANELHGTGESSRLVHAACGTDFPSCGGEFLPFGRSRSLDIHLTHRVFVYLASALVLALVATMLVHARRARSPERRHLSTAALTALAILVAQVLLGAINVWAGEHAWLVIAHLAAATLLWSSLVYVSLLVLLVQRSERARLSREATVEAVPA
jgi:cytochrome c oxidase assembly protein subunit 15